MEISARTKLRPLKDADLTTRDRAEDIRSRKVVDARGEEIGKVDELLIDEGEQKVRFLQVASGGFLGIGRDKVLIPVEAITEIEDEVVYIDQARDRIEGAPKYDPELVDDNYLRSIYTHYGLAPYWGAGYVYPSFPSYPRSHLPAERRW